MGDEVGACRGEHSFPEEEIILEKSSRGLIQAKRLHRARYCSLYDPGCLTQAVPAGLTAQGRAGAGERQH